MYFFFLSIKRSVHPFCLLVELMFSKKINIQSLKRIFYVCELGSTVSPELLKYSKQKNGPEGGLKKKHKLNFVVLHTIYFGGVPCLNHK